MAMTLNKKTKTEVVFVDRVPIYQKSDIHNGGHVRRYYVWITLNKMVDDVISFRKKNGNINWKSVSFMFKKDSKVWVEYPCSTIAHLLVLFASLIGSNEIILNVHDFTVLQSRDFIKNPPFVKRFRLHLIERLLIKRAHIIILAWPGMLDFFTPGKKQKLLIMVPGVGDDELFPHLANKNNNGKKIALYFGSMKRKGMIPWISQLFSELRGWELHLIGQKGDEEIVEKENVKYTGSVSHDKLFEIICKANLVLIPNPKNDYMDRFIPMKAAYTLLSCKPVIATRLQGLSEYITMVGLEENVVYLDEWTPESLKGALKKAENIKIDVYKTIEKLRPLSWEPRFNKAIDIVFNESRNSVDQIEWV